MKKELYLKAGYVYWVSYDDKSKVSGAKVRNGFPAVTLLPSYKKLRNVKVEMIKYKDFG